MEGVSSMDITDVSVTTVNSYLATVNTSMNKPLNDTIFRNLVQDHLYVGDGSFVMSLLVFLYIPVFIAGFLGNGLLMFIILARRRLRNGTNLFLCNLAFADLCGKFNKVYSAI